MAASLAAVVQTVQMSVSRGQAAVTVSQISEETTVSYVQMGTIIFHFAREFQSLLLSL